MYRLVLWSVAVRFCTSKEHPIFRVIGGQADTNNKYPFVIALVMSFQTADTNESMRLCTGSVIAKHWVITAGHCVTTGPPPSQELSRVVFGDLTIDPHETKFFRNVLCFKGHPQYRNMDTTDIMGLQTESLNNDIALVMIDALDLDYYGKLSAIDYTALIGRSVVYVGAGSTSTDQELYKHPRLNPERQLEDDRRPLQYANAAVTACEPEGGRVYHKLEKSVDVIQPVICLVSPCKNRHGRAQKGDSGGPLFYKGKIVGVCSGHNPLQVLYTPISPYLNWIKHTVATFKQADCKK